MRGQSSSPNALVVRSKLRLEGKKKKNSFQVSKNRRDESKYSVFRNTLFSNSQFSYLSASLRSAQLKPEMKIKKEKKAKPPSDQHLSVPPLKLSHLFPRRVGGVGAALRNAVAPSALVSIGWGARRLEQNCHLRSFTLPVELIKTLSSVLIQAK